jgi:hypothetical protein
MQLPDKFWYYVGAVVFLAGGVYEALQGSLMFMTGSFLAMAVCYGIAVRGRNQWMK